MSGQLSIERLRLEQLDRKFWNDTLTYNEAIELINHFYLVANELRLIKQNRDIQCQNTKL